MSVVHLISLSTGSLTSMATESSSKPGTVSCGSFVSCLFAVGVENTVLSCFPPVEAGFLHCVPAQRALPAIHSQTSSNPNNQATLVQNHT